MPFDLGEVGLSGAENGTQTRDPQLGRLVLYRLSYFRKNSAGRDFCASLRFVELQKQAFARLAEDFRSLPFFRGPRHNLLWWGKRRHASLLLRQAQSVRPRCRTRGCGWIRTTEAEKQQIYSLPHLATLEHTLAFGKSRYRMSPCDIRSSIASALRLRSLTTSRRGFH